MSAATYQIPLSRPYGAYPQFATAPNAGIEYQVIPEVIQVPYQQTVMVPQITYQQRYVQVPVQQTVQIPRQVSYVQLARCLCVKIIMSFHLRRI
jgi:hypothetical protein